MKQFNYTPSDAEIYQAIKEDYANGKAKGLKPDWQRIKDAYRLKYAPQMSMSEFGRLLKTIEENAKKSAENEKERETKGKEIMAFVSNTLKESDARRKYGEQTKFNF